MRGHEAELVVSHSTDKGEVTLHGRISIIHSVARTCTPLYRRRRPAGLDIVCHNLQVRRTRLA